MSTILKTAPIAQSDEDDERWQAVLRRDATNDGQFYLSVASTGIYCRPGCPARTPKRENVAFHATREQAERAGFRPCKRCKPDRPSLAEEHAARVTEACRLIETAEDEPRLADLAAQAGLSPHHFHRVFKAIAGVTPKAYALAHRHARVRTELGKDKTVTEAIHGAGYNSAGRFYASAPDVLGMTPTKFRKGGVGEDINFAVGTTSLGKVLVAATEKGVCAILFGDSSEALEDELRAYFPKARVIAGDKDFDHVVSIVIAFVEEPRRGLDLPLDIRGTAFQHRVWQALRDIPAGKTATYAEIAAKIGAPKAVRAVGSACGANPIAVAVPCHRVIGSSGALTGYRGGLPRKRILLDREAKS